jgi:hypothetical protein
MKEQFWPGKKIQDQAVEQLEKLCSKSVSRIPETLDSFNSTNSRSKGKSNNNARGMSQSSN